MGPHLEGGEDALHEEIAEVLRRVALDRLGPGRLRLPFPFLVHSPHFGPVMGDRVGDLLAGQLADVPDGFDRPVGGFLFLLVSVGFVDLKVDALLGVGFFEEVGHFRSSCAYSTTKHHYYSKQNFFAKEPKTKKYREAI